MDPCISTILVRTENPTDAVADRACRATLSNPRSCIVRVTPGISANASSLSKHTLEAGCMTHPLVTNEYLLDPAYTLREMSQ